MFVVLYCVFFWKFVFGLNVVWLIVEVLSIVMVKFGLNFVV